MRFELDPLIAVMGFWYMVFKTLQQGSTTHPTSGSGSNQGLNELLLYSLSEGLLENGRELYFL
jgi:hypothetical protein